MFAAHNAPVKVPAYYGSIEPDNVEGLPPFLLFEDLSAGASPLTHPGLNAKQLREVALFVCSHA